MQALAEDDERVVFWRRHTVSGVVLCLVLPAMVALRTLTSPDAPDSTLVLLMTAVVAGPSPLLLLVPVDRLVRHPRGRLFYDAWEAVGIVLVIVLCLLDGGARSPYVLFLFVLLAHAALAYPPMGVALAGSSIVTGYLAMGLGAGGVPVHDLVLVTGALVVTTATCVFASANHVRVYERTAAYAKEIAALAERDGLTGTLNHRAFHERLERETGRADEHHPVSLLIVDVDRFKDVNDAHGHPAGDGVLALVGSILTDLTRPGDAAGRLGGDEFALLLPGTGTQQAAGVAERLLERVRAAGAAHGVTVSAGLATAITPRAGAPGAAALHAAADAAAYRAKRGGRDRVVIVPELAAFAPTPG